jgi:hypothetical protein
MMCVLRMRSTPSYIVQHGQFGIGKLGNHREPPMHGGMQPLEERGPERWRRRCGCTQGVPASWLPLRGRFLGEPRPCPRRCPAQNWLLVRLLLGSFALFCFTLSYVAPFWHFPMYFMCISYKILSSQYMWKYVNNTCICVISLFISPILDFI